MKKVFLLLCIILLISQTVFAEKQEWVDKTYDFTKIKKVLVYPLSVPDTIKNGIVEKGLAEAYIEKTKLPDVQIVDLSTLLYAIQRDTGIDILALRKVDPKEAIKQLDIHTPDYVDAVIYAEITNYGTGSKYRESSSYTTTEYETSYINGPRGTTATVQSPVNKTHVIPGGDALVLYAGVRWDIRDAKTNNVIFSRIDSRSKMPGRFESGTPENMYKRILDSFFKDFGGKLAKG